MSYEPCQHKGCCYAIGGGVAKCSKCDLEYKEFVKARINSIQKGTKT